MNIRMYQVISSKLKNIVLTKNNWKPLRFRNVYTVSSLHAKMFREHENNYAYEVMSKKGYVLNINRVMKLVNNDDEDITTKLQEQWSKRTASDLIETLRTITPNASQNNICISNIIFDDYIDNLTDNIKYLSDEELKEVFYLLNQWPETESIWTRNYVELWAALDDECLKRMKDWSIQQNLSFLSLMFMLNIIKNSDYSYKCLQRLINKVNQLTPGEFVQTIFYIGILRSPPEDMHNLEVHLEKNISNFTVEDIGIMSMGFFKSKTPLRNLDLVTAIIEKVIENSHDINEILLAALMKIVRYSMQMSKTDIITRLLDALEPQVHRLSLMCSVQIALVGTANLTFHEKCLNAIATNALKNLSAARIKDLERLIFTFGTFNFIPQTDKPFLDTILNELRNRHAEFSKYGRSFASCVSFLALHKTYPADLIDKVLQPDFLNMSYGKNCFTYGREILTLHNTAEIFLKDDNINRLDEKKVIILAKKFTDYVPNPEYQKQYNASERMMMDIILVLKESRGEEFVLADHILTHYQRGDIIICNDMEDNPIKVCSEKLSKFGPIKRLPDDGNKWIVFVMAGRNSLINGTNTPTGPFQLKIRQLKTLGYYPALVIWSKWAALETYSDKYNYLKELIKETSKK